MTSHAFRMSLARLCGLKKASFSIACSISGSNTGRVNGRFERGRLRDACCSVLEDVDAPSSGPLPPAPFLVKVVVLGDVD